MTECLSRTHFPGEDGEVFGVAPDQSVLYEWMRVLAGGGTSEFSGIRMRGPLTLSDGLVVKRPDNYIRAASGGVTTRTLAPGISQTISLNLGLNYEFAPGNVKGILPNTTVGCVNNGPDNLVLSATLALSLKVVQPLATIILTLRINGVDQLYTTPQVRSTVADEYLTITGLFVVAVLIPTYNFTFTLTSDIATDVDLLDTCLSVYEVGKA